MALLTTSEISAQGSRLFSLRLRRQKPGEEAAGSKPRREQLYQSHQVPPALGSPVFQLSGQSPKQAGPPALQRRCSGLEMSSQDPSRYGQSLNLTVLGRQWLSPGETGAQRLTKGH